MARDLRLGLITGAAVIAGAAVAGAGSYLSSQTVLKGQLAREERVERIGSRGTAQVYAEQLAGADAVLGVATIDGRWPSRVLSKLYDLPTLQERRLVMSHLSLGAAAALAGADAAMRSVSIDLETKAGERVGTTQRRKNLVASDALRRGELALQELDR
jgi:hypothetical protein